MIQILQMYPSLIAKGVLCVTNLRFKFHLVTLCVRKEAIWVYKEWGLSTSRNLFRHSLTLHWVKIELVSSSLHAGLLPVSFYKKRIEASFLVKENDEKQPTEFPLSTECIGQFRVTGKKSSWGYCVLQKNLDCRVPSKKGNISICFFPFGFFPRISKDSKMVVSM